MGARLELKALFTLLRVEDETSVSHPVLRHT